MTKSITPRFDQCIQSSSRAGMAPDSNAANIEFRHLVATDYGISDPFLHYSNDATRMNHLRMLNVDNDMNTSTNTSTTSPSPNHEEPTYVQRRSILSFELHPLLVLEDVLQDIYEEGEEMSPPTSNDSNGSNNRDVQNEQYTEEEEDTNNTSPTNNDSGASDDNELQRQQPQPTENGEGEKEDDQTDVSKISQKQLLKMLLEM